MEIYRGNKLISSMQFYIKLLACAYDSSRIAKVFGISNARRKWIVDMQLGFQGIIFSTKSIPFQSLRIAIPLRICKQCLLNILTDFISNESPGKRFFLSVCCTKKNNQHFISRFIRVKWQQQTQKMWIGNEKDTNFVNCTNKYTNKNACIPSCAPDNVQF